MLRSHTAGSLRDRDSGQQVTLVGWVARRRDHGGVIFIDLRDASGIAQVVFRAADVLEQAHRLRAEFCVAVQGIVVSSLLNRPSRRVRKCILTKQCTCNIY